MTRPVAACLAALLLAAPSSAQVVTFTKIADTSTAMPGGGTFATFGSFPSIDGSSVAFSSPSGNASAIYAGSGGAVSTLVPAGAAVPNGSGTFANYNQSFRYDGGTVAFIGNQPSGTAIGVYTANGSTLARSADTATAIPGGTGNFTSFSPFPSVSGGTVAFTGSGASSQQGVYTSTGGATPAVAVVADKNTAAPGTAGTFTGFGSNPSISGSTVVFRASSNLGGNAGVYMRTGTGPITTVADTTTPVPGGGGNFAGPFSEPAVSGSNASFIVNNGVYALLNGTLTTIANTNTPSPNGSGNFTSITTYAPISGSDVAFIGSTLTTKGIYYYDGTLHTIVDNTMVLDGRQLTSSSNFFLGIDALGGNRVAFNVLFSTGSNGVYMATFTPVPEPSTLALVGAGALALVRRLGKARRLNPVDRAAPPA